MKTAYFKFYSKNLNKDFEFEVFGHSGKPFMVFPCSEATFYQYKDSGMVKLLSKFIERGDLRLITISSVDRESWYKLHKDKSMGNRHKQYEDCVMFELIPYIRENCGINECFLATGTSWGAYHSLNFYLKYPDYFDSAVCLSGAYSLKSVIGNYFDNSVYYNDILMYLPGMTDDRTLQKLRENYLIISHGTGDWELWNDEAAFVSENLRNKGIDHWYSVWNQAYPHDWPAWKEQMLHFLNSLKDGVITKDGVRKIIGYKRRIKLFPK